MCNRLDSAYLTLDRYTDEHDEMGLDTIIAMNRLLREAMAVVQTLRGPMAHVCHPVLRLILQMHHCPTCAGVIDAAVSQLCSGTGGIEIVSSSAFSTSCRIEGDIYERRLPCSECAATGLCQLLSCADCHAVTTEGCHQQFVPEHRVQHSECATKPDTIAPQVTLDCRTYLSFESDSTAYNGRNNVRCSRCHASSDYDSICSDHPWFSHQPDRTQNVLNPCAMLCCLCVSRRPPVSDWCTTCFVSMAQVCNNLQAWMPNWERQRSRRHLAFSTNPVGTGSAPKPAERAPSAAASRMAAVLRSPP